MRAPLIAIGVTLVSALAGPAAAGASITVGPATVTSPGETGSVAFTVTRSMNVLALSAATVKISTVDGTGTGGSDYTPLVAQTVSLPASTLGASQTTVTVPLLADALDEADEDFTIVLSEPSSGESLGTPSSARGVITDDDLPPTVTLGTPSPAAEGTGTDGPGLAFPVTLSSASGKAITVDYATADGTATAGQDFTATTGTLAIPAGATGGTVTVPVVPDAVDEDDETLAVTLSAPANATLAPTPTANGTIVDDDTTSLTVTGVVVPEGAAGTTSVASAQIDLSTTSSRPVTVTFATLDGTASAPGDYTATTGQVTVPAGQRFALVPVTIMGDATPEAIEVLGLRISAPANAVIAGGGDLAPIVITNDDGAVPAASSGTGTLPLPTTGGGTPFATGGGTASQAVRLAKPSFSRTTGRLRYKVTCPRGGGACRVALTVFSVPAPKSRVKALRREQQLASRTKTVPEGQSVTFELRLSTRARGWLRTAKTMRANAYAVSKDATNAFSTARVAATLKR
jgi:hypothetical protein